jgi:hypothetical protein
MDNKQDRKFYWEVKDFMGKKHAPQAAPTSQNPNLVNSVKNVLEQNKVYKQSSFNSNINSANTIRQAITAMEAGKARGTPESVAYTKNIASNPFGVLKEGIFDILANDKKSNIDLVSKPKQNEISPLIANPSVEPGTSGSINGKNLNVAPIDEPQQSFSDKAAEANKLVDDSGNIKPATKSVPTQSEPAPTENKMTGKDVTKKISSMEDQNKISELESQVSRARGMSTSIGREGTRERGDALRARSAKIRDANLALTAEKQSQQKSKQQTGMDRLA